MPNSSLRVYERPPYGTIRAPVLKVFDGDGFLTKFFNPLQGSIVEVTARFGFIDAPEMEQPGGPEAKAFLSSLITDKWLELSILLKTDTGKIVDKYGRVVCVPYLEDDNRIVGRGFGRLLQPFLPSSNRFRNIELEMVLNGWAWVLDRYCPDDAYYDALSDAQNHKRGIWARSRNEDPWEFKKRRFTRTSLSLKPRAKIGKMDEQQGGCPNPGCDGRLVKKKGRFGPFIGCSEFPSCRYTQNPK